MEGQEQGHITNYSIGEAEGRITSGLNCVTQLIYKWKTHRCALRSIASNSSLPIFVWRHCPSKQKTPGQLCLLWSLGSIISLMDRIKGTFWDFEIRKIQTDSHRFYYFLPSKYIKDQLWYIEYNQTVYWV